MTTLPATIAAAIFDFDETMIDLEAQHTAAYEALCCAMGSDYARMPENFRFGSGRRVIDDIREMRAFFGWTENEQSLFEMRQQAFDDILKRSHLELLPGVERTVRTLQAKGLPMAIASSAVRNSIEAILQQLGIRDCFAVIVDGSEVVHGKPDPEAYLVTARKLGVEPSRCLVFEDSHVGVMAAKSAGMYCVAVRNPRARIEQDVSAADEVLASFDEFSA